MQIPPRRYMDVRTDFGFKKLFGQEESKPILKGFLFDLLDLSAPIAELHFLSTEQLPRTSEERKSIFDIYCIDESGRRFIVEMQKAEQLHFKNRALYYSTFPIVNQVKKGDWDYQLNPVYCVGILNFTFQNDDRYIHRVRLIEETTHEVFSDKLTFVYVELPKFNLGLEELETFTDKWIYFLKHTTEFEEIPEGFSESPFDLAFHLVELAQLTAEEADYYEGSLKQARDRYAENQTAHLKGREEGMAEGIEKGREEGGKLRDIAIAQMLIKQQVPLATVLQATGLTEEEVQPFLNENQT